jgi:GH15 family glucan-1,4-alpha-glucosidase
MIGQNKRARETFERVLDLRNDVGLLSEEWDPKAKRQLGNTPQAFSHVPLVNTARALSTTGAKVGRESRREPRHHRREPGR